MKYYVYISDAKVDIMKKSLCFLFVLLLILPVALTADEKNKPTSKTEKAKSEKDRERIYSAPFDKVWDASIKAANEQFTVEHSDKGSGIFSFDTGKAMKAKRYRIAVTVTVIDANSTRVTLRLQVIEGPTLWGSKKDQTVIRFWNAMEEKLGL